ncbi:segregation and condensation protein A [Patescibacteria group bacterium]
MSSAFEIKTDVFEGPLDLLLSLIEKRKFFINDISLAAVADEYIEYTKRLEDFSVKNTADFVLVASTLVLIKSKSLLPTLSLTEEEKESVEDLETRLKIYKRMRELGEGIEKSFGKNMMFEKTIRKNTEMVFSPDKYTNTENIFASIKDVLKKLPKKDIIPQAVVQKVISLEERMDNLAERIKNSFKMSFTEFSGMGKKERVDVVVSFLAMLELVKQNVIDVKQDMKFGDIDIESKEVGTPKYE